MQYSERLSILLQTTASVLKCIRQERTKSSINSLANQYEMSKSNLSKIEKGNNNFKLDTLWKLAESLEMKPSELVKIIEDELGESFTLLDK